jgi:hypothetical protein
VSFGVRRRTDKSVSNPAASEEDAAPHAHDSTLEPGGERSSKGGSWAVSFDGPSHFLASRVPTGATLLKRRHLQLLGHAVVSVPYE